MTSNRTLLLAAVSGLAVAGSVGAAHAGAFGLRTQSTIALGQAFAGNASGAAGVSSMFWNPATITMQPGYTSEYNFSYVDASARIRVLPPTPTLALGANSGELAQDAFVPASFSAYQVNDRIWVGLASAAPFGSITKPNTVWAGQTYSRSSRVYSLNFSPTIGIKLTDWLSIGMGPTVQYFKVRLNSAAGAAPGAGTVILEGDDVSAGASVGVLLTPMQGTAIGVGFRSSIRHELNGTFRTPAGVVPVRVGLNLPEQLTVGLSQAISNDLRLNLGFEWMNWSRLGTPAIVASNFGLPVGPFALRYKDGYLYSIGGEYRLNNQWELRAGAGYEVSPIDVSNRSTRLPDTDRVYASVGASYQWNEKLKINASYAHYFSVGNKALRIVPGSALYNGLPFYGETRADVNVLSLGATYRWDNPQVAEAAPIVRKY